MGLLNQTCKRLIIALTGRQYGQNVAGAIGLYGGARITGSADTVQLSTGDISLQLDSGGAPCTYRATFPALNSQIASIDWFQVSGFTPRSPAVAETLMPLVTGYNFDTTLNQWYITIQIVPIGG